MKTTLPILMTMALTTAGFTQAAAGDREWATAGKVLTGVVAGAFIARALDPGPPVYVAPAYAPAPVVYHTPPVVYQPAPVVHHPAPVYVAAPAIPPVVVVPAAPTVVVYPQPVCAPVHYRPAPMMMHRVPVYVPPPAVRVQFHFGGHYRGHGHR